MVKLKDDKICRRHDQHDPVVMECRFGWCMVMRCPWCPLLSGFDWGPLDCPHKKSENGTLRWYKFPDMDSKVHVPVKRNKDMRKRNQPRK